MNGCPSEDLLAAYQTGSCDDHAAVAIESHLESCDLCRSKCEFLHTDDDVLSGLRRVMSEEARIPVAGEEEKTVQFTAQRVSDLGSGETLAAGIEGYQLVRELGRGGMGVVYLAVQQSTKRQVALKVLIEGPFASPSAKRRFEREVELAAQLQHPHIVTILESGIASGRYYFAMQYVEGQRLDTFVNGRKLSLTDRLRLFRRICEAVNYAHQRGVIHRDLKPSNIIIDAEGRPHILDFGLAKPILESAEAEDLKSLSVTGQVIGTLPYMSPEQATGSGRDIDIRTDVYSLGVILYEMLTGRFPYEVVGQVADILRNIAEVAPQRPSTLHRQINNEIETIVLKALAKEKERRYQSADNLARDIERYLAGEPIEAKRDSGWYVMRKTLRRYRTPLSVALVIVLLFGMTLTLVLRQRTRLARAAAQEALSGFVNEPAQAIALARAATGQAARFMTAAAGRYVNSPAYTERIVGARSGLLLCPEEFWASVDGGALWDNGEWLELCHMPREDVAFVLPLLREKAASGTDRQKYIAFCLLGRLAEPGGDLADFCAAAVAAESNPGVVAAAWWAAGQLGHSVDLPSGDGFFQDELAEMAFVAVPAAEGFRRGSDPDDPDRFEDEERPETGVALDQIYLGMTEVTWGAFRRFLEADGGDAMYDPQSVAIMERLLAGLPAEMRDDAAAGRVSLDAARAYCDWLSERGMRMSPPRRYRLPTEEEWEHACRAGKDARFCYGDSPDYMRFFGYANGEDTSWHVTGRRMPNWYGLFDMHGGVWEWTDSPYGEPVQLQEGMEPLQRWTFRGGAFYSPAVRCRCAQRNAGSANAQNDYVGFRLVMELIER